MSANDKQVAGTHYKSAAGVQHWDVVVDQNLNYFEGQITKYVMRARKKNGMQDLQKAAHFLEKYMEVYYKMYPTTAPQSHQPHPAMNSKPLDLDTSQSKVVLTGGSGGGPTTSYVDQDRVAKSLVRGTHEY